MRAPSAPPSLLVALCAVALVGLASMARAGSELTRDLGDLFPDQAAGGRAWAEVPVMLGRVEAHRGRLGDGAGELEAGSSKPPVEILKAGGVDLTSPAPAQALMRAANRVVDQMEEILDRRNGA